MTPRYVRDVAARFGSLPQVIAVALGGSRPTSEHDPGSDFDLYVYTNAPVPLDFRRSLAGTSAEIDNRFWEPGDEWVDAASGARMDVMYRSPEWIEDQLSRVLDRHEASVGYSTCFWYNVLHSEPLHDPEGWFARLQQRARVPYPEELRQAVIAKNFPILRQNQSSYRRQIEVAIKRGDHVSRQHRVTALLASIFDIWFALERHPHPGEKRLLDKLPPEFSNAVREVLAANDEQLLQSIDALLDGLDASLHQHR